MNPIECYESIGFYTDLSRTARFYFSEIARAVNDCVEEFMDEMNGDEDSRLPTNFQWTQQVRDNLYTLIKTNNPTLTPAASITTRYGSFIPTTFPFPADYYDFISLTTLIDGFTSFSRPTSYAELGPLLQDSFKMPTNKLTYYNEYSLGFRVWRGNSGTFTSAELTYLKAPTDFSIGSENNLINAGGALTNLVTYYAMETSVYATITYQIGDIITGTGAALTSGQVIPVSVTSGIDLPPKTHETICKRAAAKLLGTIGMFDSSAFAEKEGNKPE